MEDEADIGGQGVGMHSQRKYPATTATHRGCTPHEVEICGHWKKQGGHIVFRYIDVKQLYYNAKVAGALCIGGAVKYELKNSVADSISQSWIYEHFIPHI